MTIDAYLSELRRLLPLTARLRALPEVREHLRDAAARHREAGMSAGDAEMRATGEFGDVREVAARLGDELVVRDTRAATMLALAAVTFFVFPFYVVPENTLPPATWTEKPAELLLLQRVVLGLWLAAVGCAAAAVVLAWSRWSRASSAALIAATVAITAATAFSAVLSWRWVVLSPTTPNLALATALALPVVATCLAAAWWTSSSRRRLALVD